MKKKETSFERFEYKYWATEQDAEKLERWLAPYLRCDDWVQGGQRVTSLYLDSPDLDFMKLHTESVPDRCKLRVRTYGDPPEEPAFFEIKRKIKAVTFKHRATVPLAAVPHLLRGEPIPAPQLQSAEEERTLADFLYLMMTYHAEPKVLLTYRRTAYTSTEADEGVRVTLDRDVCYQRARGYSLTERTPNWTRLCGFGSSPADATTLIEIKFRGAAPWWLRESLQEIGLATASYSKYVSAMLLEDLGPCGPVELDRQEPLEWQAT